MSKSNVTVTLEDCLRAVTSNGTQGAMFLVSEMLSDVKRHWSISNPIKEGGSMTFEIEGRLMHNKLSAWRVREGDVVLFNPDTKEVRVLQAAPTKMDELRKETTGVLGTGESDLTEEQMRYINKVAPEHTRHSCGEGEDPQVNAWYGKGDTLFGRCVRCTLVKAALGEAEEQPQEY